MTVYIRRTWSDVWHWMAACSHYPYPVEGQVIEEELPDGQRPQSGELCNRCRSVEKRKLREKREGESDA